MLSALSFIVLIANLLLTFDSEYAIISNVKEMIQCLQFQCSGESRSRCTTQTIKDLEVIEGNLPSKQLKMVLGWAAIRQDQLMENWELAVKKQELFAIEPLR